MSIPTKDFNTLTPCTDAGDATKEALRDPTPLSAEQELTKNATVEGYDGDDDGDSDDWVLIGSSKWMLEVERERERREATFVEELKAIDTALNDMRDTWEKEMTSEKSLAEPVLANSGGLHHAHTLDAGSDLAHLSGGERRELLEEELRDNGRVLNEICTAISGRIQKEKSKKASLEAAILLWEFPEQEELLQRLKGVIDAESQAIGDQEARIAKKRQEINAFISKMHERLSGDEEKHRKQPNPEPIFASTSSMLSGPPLVDAPSDSPAHLISHPTEDLDDDPDIGADWDYSKGLRTEEEQKTALFLHQLVMAKREQDWALKRRLSEKLPFKAAPKPDPAPLTQEELDIGMGSWFIKQEAEMNEHKRKAAAEERADAEENVNDEEKVIKKVKAKAKNLATSTKAIFGKVSPFKKASEDSREEVKQHDSEEAVEEDGGADAKEEAVEIKDALEDAVQKRGVSDLTLQPL